MSFSADVKEDLSKNLNFSPDILKAELIGYYFCGNMVQREDVFEFVTENEFSVEHFYKILFNLGIDYEPEVRGKTYVTQISLKKFQQFVEEYKSVKEDCRKSIAKGVFLGSGSINNPAKNYHLEITLRNQEVSNFFICLCKEYDINFKQIQVNNKYQVYLKEGEEISKFLAFIGANKSVLQFEDIRVMKEMKNNVNRKVNCETANLNRTIEASLKQIDDINFLKKAHKFNLIPSDLQEIAILRLENPDLSLLELGKLLKPQIGKSAVNRKLKKIHDLAEELR